MGIPGLYRWLVDRYPRTLCCVAEERSRFSDGPTIDTTTPNPNGVEFDNLYIDMNGVIHPCFHPEGLPAPRSYDDVLRSIFRYIDRVFSIVRPRKLLFLAVDGVAPRAKMNHQRIRRFRTAREAEAAGGKGEGKLDSNVITPGTEFMDLLSSALAYYVHLRMNTDHAWRKIKVVLSDSTVVGEGEHKILSYMRSQRNMPGYDPSTRHCFHGLDADLIMLALATHEIHVSILREVITYGKYSKFHSNAKYPESIKRYLDHLQFEFFNIWVLREYLERELLPNVQGTDFERLIDDFVFFCIFVGNDFLPHLPSLDIAEGGIELLLFVYQQEFPKMGYLTDSSKVNLKSMEHFLQALSIYETAIFKERAQKKWKTWRSVSQVSASDVERHNNDTKPIYYTHNFDCERHEIDRIKSDAVLKYTQGVCWIMHYYYQGVCSWQWFYPYHYAPFASDFCGLDNLEIGFTLGQPLKPLDQLLGVLPAASAQALPLSYRELMSKESSPILDFYPRDAKIDLNGKMHTWQGVCKLPFIDESRLLSETLKLEHALTAEEKQRNRFGRDRLYVHSYSNPLGRLIKDHQPTPTDPNAELEIQINPRLSDGMNGYLFISDKPVCPPQITSPVDVRLKHTNLIKSVDYKWPCNVPHVPKLLSGVIMPPKILRAQDIPPPIVFTKHSSLLKVGGEHEKENQIRQAEGKEVCEKPENTVRVVTPTNTDNQPENRKTHKKKKRVKVEGEDEMNGGVDKEQKNIKMIDETGNCEEKTRNDMVSHGVEVEEIKDGGDGKRKKQKKSKSALGEDEKSNDSEGGEKRKKKKKMNKEQENVDMIGQVEEEKVGESKRKKHPLKENGEEPVVDSKRKKHKKKGVSEPQVQEEKDMQVET